MNYYTLPVILFLSLCLLACGPAHNEAAVDSIKTETNSSIAKTDVKPAPEEKNFTLETFPASWLMLSIHLNDYVVYRSCNAETPTIDIQNTEEGYKLDYLMGQSADRFTILRLEKIGEQEYEITCDHNQTAKIVFKEPTNSITDWTWYYSDTKEIIHESQVYILKSKAGTYPCIKEENCEEMF